MGVAQRATPTFLTGACVAAQARALLPRRPHARWPAAPRRAPRRARAGRSRSRSSAAGRLRPAASTTRAGAHSRAGHHVVHAAVKPAAGQPAYHLAKWEDDGVRLVGVHNRAHGLWDPRAATTRVRRPTDHRRVRPRRTRRLPLPQPPQPQRRPDRPDSRTRHPELVHHPQLLAHLPARLPDSTICAGPAADHQAAVRLVAADQLEMRLAIGRAAGGHVGKLLPPQFSRGGGPGEPPPMRAS